MRYLGLALVAEGAKDYLFLPALLSRTVQEVVRNARSRGNVEIGDPIDLSDLLNQRIIDRASQIIDAASKAKDSYDILFIHTDGNGDAEAAFRDRFKPAAHRFASEINVNKKTVSVIPVRETEAWALADGDALRSAFGANVEDDDLGVPRRARDVERILDPKRELERALANVLRNRRNVMRRASEKYLPAISERIRLDRLQSIPSFQHLETQIRDALMSLEYIY